MARIHHCLIAACWWDKCPGPRDYHDCIHLHLQGRDVAGNRSAFPLLETSMIMHTAFDISFPEADYLPSVLSEALKDTSLPCWRGMAHAIEKHTFPHTLLTLWLHINIILTDWVPCNNNAVGVESTSTLSVLRCVHVARKSLAPSAVKPYFVNLSCCFSGRAAKVVGIQVAQNTLLLCFSSAIPGSLPTCFSAHLTN